MQMAPKHFAWTPYGWLATATTINGHGRGNTSHIVGSEGVIFGQIQQCKSGILGMLRQKPPSDEGLGGSEHFYGPLRDNQCHCNGGLPSLRRNTP